MIGVSVLVVLVVVVVLLVWITIIMTKMMNKNNKSISLVGQTVIITGVAPNNIGASFAWHCADMGANRLILLYWNVDCSQLSHQLILRFPTCQFVFLPVDLCDQDAVEQQLHPYKDSVDMIIISHVICSHYMHATDIPTHVLQLHLNVNFISVTRLVQYFHHRYTRFIVLSTMAVSSVCTSPKIVI